MRSKFCSGWATLGMVAAGCGDTAGVQPAQGIAVSVMAQGAEPGAAASASGAVTIDGLRLVLGGIKLETAGLDDTKDWAFAESRVVDIALDGEPVTGPTVIEVPAWTYKELEISIDKLEPGHPAEEPLIAQHPDMADASIAITGRVLRNGSEESFTFTAALDRDMEIPLEPLLLITGAGEPGVQVTLVLRTASWFFDAAGEWLDPTDPANRSAIEANIQASFEAFEDGDLDGRPGPITR